MHEDKEKTNPTEVKRAEKRISDARARLLLKEPFFGVLLSMTNFTPESSIPTMATDGKNVFFNPKFTNDLGEDEVFGVLLHEILHCIYLHMSPKRIMNRAHKKWNVATDYAINIEITDIGYRLPPDCLLDAKFRDKNAETIYDELDDNEAASKKTFDVHLNGASDTDWDDLEDRIVAAYEIAGGEEAGNIPNSIKRWIKKLRNSKVKWERIFHRFIGMAISKDDYSYVRPNRRYVSQDLYIPDLRSPKIGSIVVAVDTSGSISERHLEMFAAEMKKLSYLVDEITVISCDCGIHEVVKIRSFTDMLKSVKFKGGGGTDFKPVFKEVRKRNITPEILIYLTDGYGDSGAKAPPYPVVWVYTDSNSPHASFGQHVHMPD